MGSQVGHFLGENRKRYAAADPRPAQAIAAENHEAQKDQMLALQPKWSSVPEAANCRRIRTKSSAKPVRLIRLWVTSEAAIEYLEWAAKVRLVQTQQAIL